MLIYILKIIPQAKRPPKFNEKLEEKLKQPVVNEKLKKSRRKRNHGHVSQGTQRP